MLASLVLAVRFLTIAPVPGREATGPGALARAAWWFPVVGVALGAALVALDRALALLFPPLLAALLVLSVWKVATGGIHLDGLADCLDGFAGRDRQHRLSIMRDSRLGAFGAIGLILYFLIALLALAEMAGSARWRLLLLAPAVGRLAPLLVGPRFAAATPDHGTGGAFVRDISGWPGPLFLVGVCGLAAGLLGPWGVAMTIAALAAVLVWSSLLAWRLGGLTGDVLGSGVELGELAILLVGAALAHRGLI
jgi:adenosylcobinamide-GDP ribazoletransferase